MKEKLLPVVISLFLVIVSGTSAAQMIDVSKWLDPRMGKRPVSGSYSISLYADEDVDNQNTDLGLIEHKARITVPIWQNERRELALTARGELQDIDTKALLPENNVPLPGDLWELRFGANYRARLSNQWMWGGQRQFRIGKRQAF